MKQLIATVLVFCIAFSLSACCILKNTEPDEPETQPATEAEITEPATTAATEPEETAAPTKKMPDVTGLPVSDAMALLTFFENVETKNVYNEKAAGIVAEQSVTAGTLLTADAQILLSVSIGPKPEESGLPYLENVKHADQPIYSGPSYNSRYVGIVEEAGVYTIVDEAWDDYGELWGKLKSGVGWINLTNSRNRSALLGGNNYFVFAYEAGDNEKGDIYVADNAIDYAQKIGFTATRNITINLFEINVMADIPEVVRYLSCEYLRSGETLIAELGFHGDFTTYGVSVTDDNGITQRFEVTQSLMDGSLCFSKV